MLVGPSKWEYILVRCIIFAFSSFAILLGAYLIIVLLASGVDGLTAPFNVFVIVLLVIETLFYLAWYLPLKSRLQAQSMTPDPLTRSQRRAQFFRGLDFMPDTEIYVRKWHLDAHLDDIRRENIKDWLLWALWDRDATPDDPRGGKGWDEGDENELDEYVDEVEDRLERNIRKGRGDAVAMRLNFDKVPMRHRSLLFYTIIGFLDMVTTLALYARGFKFYRLPRSTFLQVFPFRPMTLLSPTESPSATLSYFIRPHKSTTRRPVVFLHGVGIGLTQYLPHLLTLPSDVGVIALELLPISSRVCPFTPPTSEIVASILKIVQHHGWNDFVFMGHSYGTLYAAPLLQHPEVAPRINSVILVDPVSLLLHLPNVAFNFTARKPRNGGEWEIHYIATDPFVSHTLHRRFIWREYMLWLEALAGRKLTVVLGERDCVTHPDAVASYVYFGDVNFPVPPEDREIWRNTEAMWTGRGDRELIFIKEFDHGHALLTPRGMKMVKKVIEAYTSLSEPRGAETGVIQEEGRGLGTLAEEEYGGGAPAYERGSTFEMASNGLGERTMSAAVPVPEPVYVDRRYSAVASTPFDDDRSSFRRESGGGEKGGDVVRSRSRGGYV